MLKFTNIMIIIITISIVSETAAAKYSPDAFIIQNKNGDKVITNQDVHCVNLSSPNTATITLSSEARRFFYKYTKDSVGDVFSTLICGKSVSESKLNAPISGKMTIDNLKPENIKCLKDSFNTRAVCQDCPVCRIEKK